MRGHSLQHPLGWGAVAAPLPGCLGSPPRRECEADGVGCPSSCVKARGRSGSSVHKNRSVLSKATGSGNQVCSFAQKTCFLPQCPRRRWSSGISPDISLLFKDLLGLNNRVLSPHSRSPFVNDPFIGTIQGLGKVFILNSPGQQALVSNHVM